MLCREWRLRLRAREQHCHRGAQGWRRPRWGDAQEWRWRGARERRGRGTLKRRRHQCHFGSPPSSPGRVHPPWRCKTTVCAYRTRKAPGAPCLSHSCPDTAPGKQGGAVSLGLAGSGGTTTGSNLGAVGGEGSRGVWISHHMLRNRTLQC